MTLQEVFLRRGVRFRVSGSDHAKVHICCPFCAARGKPADTQFRLCVHASQGWGRCVHCEWKRKRALGEVLRELLIGDDVSGVREEERSALPPPRLPEDFLPLCKATDELDRRARSYVLKRGVTPEQIRRHEIGVSYSGRYGYRIIFPVRERGKLRGFNARDFTGRQTPKYLLTRGDKYLFGFNPEAEKVVLSEGVIKALRIEQVTEACSASMLGHDLTDVQAKQILESKCTSVTLYPDTDRVGRRGFVGVADKLSGLGRALSVKIACPVTVPADEDSLEKLRSLVESAPTYSWEVRQNILLLS